MFEFPDAKRVRREDLYDSSADEEDSRDEEVDVILRDKLNAQLSGLLKFSFEDTSNDAQQEQEQEQQRRQPEDADHDHDAVEDLAFTFRLFRDEAPSHKVVLDQDDAPEQAGGGGFVVARRPASYYVAEDPLPDAMERFRAAAVTPEYLFQDAKKRRWGLEKPWRVTAITITTNGPGGVSADGHAAATAAAAAAAAEPTGRRKRPGKRRRIILRTRQKARKEREETEKSKLIDKEQHLKDKKKRLNREKKLKRRAKEREKKLSSKGEDDGAASEHINSRATSPE